MNWIEILGPSGIGKSYFLKSLVNSRVENSNWLTYEESKIHWALNSPNNDIITNSIKLYLKQNFIHKQKFNLAESLINRKKSYLQESDNFENLLEAYFNYYANGSISYKERSYRISLFHHIISNISLHRFHNIPEILVMDEGPFSHHPNLEAVNWNSQQIVPSGIIFCNLSLSDNIARIKKRRKDGRLAPLHQGLNDCELTRHIEEKHKGYYKKKQLIKNLNIPFIEVDLKKIGQDQLNMTQNFIKNVK